jgi:RNA recognition motif-containing protein
MAGVYVGNLDSRVTSGELEDEFRVFGVLRRSLIFQTLFRFCIDTFHSFSCFPLSLE